MNTAVAERPDAAVVIDELIARGDLSKLSPAQRVEHYHNVCRSLGLNPLTQPFQYVTLNGKLQLYARKDATDQLRKINGISVSIVSRNFADGLLTVHARATDNAGRTDEDFGVVAVGGLRGEAAANGVMKAVTKAKRRVTLSISGLGFLDETEVEPFTEKQEPVRRGETLGILTDQERGAINREQYGRANTADAVDPDAVHREAREALDDARLKPDEEPFAIVRHGDTEKDWSTWATMLLTYVRNADTGDRINDWITSNSDELAKLQEYDAGKYRRLVDMINHQSAIRNEKDAAQ